VATGRGELDGEPVVMILRRKNGDWTPASPVRVDVEDGRITRIADYLHCPWILPSAVSIDFSKDPT